MIDINDGRDAFMMAEEAGLQENSFHEGQSLMVQVSQEARAEKEPKSSALFSWWGTMWSIAHTVWRLRPLPA